MDGVDLEVIEDFGPQKGHFSSWALTFISGISEFCDAGQA
jgi:hypothetical protein